jgi:hypothetical protein
MSNFLALNKEDFKKIGKGAIIAVVGALMTYLTQVITTIDFGAYTPIVVAFWGIVVNTVDKYLRNNQGQLGRKDK